MPVSTLQLKNSYSTPAQNPFRSCGVYRKIKTFTILLCPNSIPNHTWKSGSLRWLESKAQGSAAGRPPRSESCMMSACVLRPAQLGRPWHSVVKSLQKRFVSHLAESSVPFQRARAVTGLLWGSSPSGSTNNSSVVPLVSVFSCVLKEILQDFCT